MAKEDPNDKNIIICDDGTRRRRNPFNPSLTPEQLCGEKPIEKTPPGDSEKPPADDMFVVIFGADPIPPGGAQDIASLGRQVRWLADKRNYRGVLAEQPFSDDVVGDSLFYGIGVPVAYRYKGPTGPETILVAFPYAPASPPQRHSLRFVTNYHHHAIAGWQIRANGETGYCPENVHPLAAQALAGCLKKAEE